MIVGTKRIINPRYNGDTGMGQRGGSEEVLTKLIQVLSVGAPWRHLPIPGHKKFDPNDLSCLPCRWITWRRLIYGIPIGIMVMTHQEHHAMEFSVDEWFNTYIDHRRIIGENKLDVIILWFSTPRSHLPDDVDIRQCCQLSPLLEMEQHNNY